MVIDDVHTDMRWSSDIRDALKEICFMLNISYKLPPERISHHWLLLYDFCTTYCELLDALVILYASWILKDMKNMYACLFNDLVKKYDVSATAILELKKIQSKMSKKKKTLTKAGRERKLCIVKKIIYAQEKLVLYMNTYKDVLCIFKPFGLAFEQKTPQIHKLNDAIIGTIHAFCAIFVSTKK